jgi:predicted nucleotide-binding protein
MSRISETEPQASKNIFIVHGTDHAPMKELKAMLHEFGLNPIVLHEQPSGSKTVVEKLEEYSDVGYAFVVLTPDDAGVPADKLDSVCDRMILGEVSGLAKDIERFGEAFKNEEASEDFFEEVEARKKYEELKNRFQETHDKSDADLILDILKPRARQNVVLEFGYFISLLGRNRVCCLHKGNVELPSDMHGIVYVPFSDSVDEARNMIVKELKAAGYEINE